MTHYICTGGCRGLSDVPKACETPGCPHVGQALVACTCEDQQHNGAFDEPPAKEDTVVNNQ